MVNRSVPWRAAGVREGWVAGGGQRADVHNGRAPGDPLHCQVPRGSFDRGRVFRRQCISTLLPLGQYILHGTGRWDIER